MTECKSPACHECRLVDPRQRLEAHRWQRLQPDPTGQVRPLRGWPAGRPSGHQLLSGCWTSSALQRRCSWVAGRGCGVGWAPQTPEPKAGPGARSHCQAETRHSATALRLPLRARLRTLANKPPEVPTQGQGTGGKPHAPQRATVPHLPCETLRSLCGSDTRWFSQIIRELPLGVNHEERDAGRECLWNVRTFPTFQRRAQEVTLATRSVC